MGMTTMEKVCANSLQALILTKDEEVNIARVLNKLIWLERVVVLDSFSTDSTLELLSKYPNVEVFFRKFDTHANQWNYGLSLIESKWVLTLDADYVLTRKFIHETIDILRVNKKDYVAYFSEFKFVVFGRPLLADNTTPRPVLFIKRSCSYFDDGHTQRLLINGKSGFLKSHIFHDDRKPLSNWIDNLNRYSVKECQKLLDPNNRSRNSLITRIRMTKVLAPLFVFFYCLIVKGLFLNGWAGWHYTIQRTIVEMVFALRLIEEEKLKAK
ncbi:MAG TPA: glycosyltransferase family 2 protein [Flavobacterium sp.]